MARTGLPYSPDVSKQVSVDRIAGIDYQDVKLLDGLEGSTTPSRVTTPTDGNATMPGLWVNGQLMVFNGTLWVFVRGDVANGLDVDVTRSVLPTGAATETTLGTLLTELQAKADLAETQPISAAALPLPTGAATQATLASLLTELQAKADLTETQPVKDAGSFAVPANFPVTTSAQQIVAANTARRGVWIENVHASATIYWGTTSGVSTANGMPIYALERVFLPTTTAVHVVGSAAADARWSELT